MDIKENISSASLFHFVKRLEDIFDILRNGFQARYVTEIFPILERPFVIPMKCFCDLPLGSIKHHIDKFGEYGIGISKEYAIENRITPCIYVHNKSYTLERYLDELGDLSEPSDKIGKSLLPYFKKYEEIIISDKIQTTLKYYDEREWRYIPRPFEFHDYFGLSLSEAREVTDSMNSSLEKDTYRLPIQLKAIKYIIVNNERDVNSLIREIRDINSYQIIQDYLLSKILTTEQILYDL